MHRASDSERKPANETEGHEEAPAEDAPGGEGKDDARADTGELDGTGQAGTSKPQPGVGQYQGGGIEGAVGGGQSGQGGG